MKENEMEKIFVSIAAYRDPELPKTIADALAQAKNPERIVFGICRQYNAADGFDNIDEWRTDNRFKIDDVLYTDSRGCCWARARVQSLWAGEEYIMQLDSHHRFARNWDEKLIEMLSRCPSKKAIITCYPPIYNVETEARSSDLLEMEPHFTNSKTVTRFRPVIRQDKGIKPHMCLAAGFLFSKGEFFKDVPYDPAIYFQGEEISMAVRAWTRGFDFFLPDELLVWHQYVPRGRIRHWTDHTAKNKAKVPFSVLDSISKKRVSDLLTGVEIEPPFGLGNMRTLDEFENSAGICFKTSTVSMETRRRQPPPVFKDGAWKTKPDKKYTIRLNWKEILPQLTQQDPHVVAVFVRERRIDIPCTDGIPAQAVIKGRWQSPPETFNVWAYRKAPLKWGKKHTLKVMDYDED